MKNFFKNIELPSFIKDSRLIVSTVTILVLSLVGSIIGFIISPLYGIAMLLLFILIAVTIFFAAYILSQNATDFVSNLSYRIKRGEQEALIKMPIGILLFDDDKQVQWVNPYLQLYLGSKDVIGKKIESVDAELSKLMDKTLHSNTSENHVVSWGNRKFEMSVQDDLGVLYLLDVTRYAKIEERYHGERLAIGQVFLDNYDELSQSMDDQAISAMNSYVTGTLSDWAKQYEMYLKRIDDDHFIILAHAQNLAVVEKDNFSILDKIRSETSKQNYPVTLSAGFAFGEANLNELATQAQRNLDLALGRGGDQVVVKESDKDARFYGGKSNPMEKRTRVRARMVSQAMQELFKDVDRVFVVGHKSPDLDSIGAALGITQIAKMNQKEAYVVLDQDNVNYDVKRLIGRIHDSDKDEQKVFVNPDQVFDLATDKSLLVMVDHSKQSITYNRDLYDRLQNRIVIIDHHRRGEEFPENPILVYIEPYASSTCELVTEMLEYQPKGNSSLTKLEASAMLAGITVDTKAFSLRTGTRTFDAASYLRSVGADNAVVQSLLKEDLNSFIQRNHLVASIEMLAPNMALLRGEEGKSYDPIIAAQAADTALSLEHIEASFVITHRSKDTVGISARSLGKINVQVIMERLGGGGHLSNAATQLKLVTIDQARAKLLDSINYKDDEE